MEMRSTEDELLALNTLLVSPNGKPARAGQAVSPQRFPRVDEVAFQGGEPGEPTWRQAPRTAVATATSWPAERRVPAASANEVDDEYAGLSEQCAYACRGRGRGPQPPAHCRFVSLFVSNLSPPRPLIRPPACPLRYAGAGASCPGIQFRGCADTVRVLTIPCDF